MTAASQSRRVTGNAATRQLFLINLKADLPAKGTGLSAFLVALKDAVAQLPYLITNL